MSTILIFAGGTKVPLSTGDELPGPDLVIAADSGYQIARALGYDVDTLIGDMDSVGPLDDIPETTSIVRFPVDKDATDLELAFELAVREQPRRIVLVGAEGGRFDHEIGAIAMICSDRWRFVPDIDWVRSDSISHVIRDTRRIQGDPGDLFSLIPVGGDATGVTTTGLQWELDGATLHAGSSRGVSNILLQTEVLIQVDDGVLLGVFPSSGVSVK
ncbi:MAG: thiamine diphosphokinase [Acidimicrobiia bacterium]